MKNKQSRVWTNLENKIQEKEKEKENKARKKRIGKDASTHITLCFKFSQRILLKVMVWSPASHKVIFSGTVLTASWQNNLTTVWAWWKYSALDFPELQWGAEQEPCWKSLCHLREESESLSWPGHGHNVPHGAKPLYLQQLSASQRPPNCCCLQSPCHLQFQSASWRFPYLSFPFSSPFPLQNEPWVSVMPNA